MEYRMEIVFEGPDTEGKAARASGTVELKDKTGPAFAFLQVLQLLHDQGCVVSKGGAALYHAPGQDVQMVDSCGHDSPVINRRVYDETK